jgi:type I restriction enzyme S subunit
MPVCTVGTVDVEDRDIKYIDIGSIDNQRNRIAEPKHLSLASAPSRARQIVKSGDVLFATVRPYLRNIAQVPDFLDDEIASTGFAVLRAAQGVEPSYLFYKAISQDFVSALTGEQYGVSYPAVKDDQVRAQPLELPPTNEQRRIVAKIEELFSELDKGAESLNAARDQLAVYRLVVLHQAISDENGSPYPIKPLDKLIGPIGQGWSPKCDVNTPPLDDEWAVIKTTAVQPMSYRPHECKPLPPDLKPRPGIQIRDGDLLMTRKGPRPRTGVVCFVEKARPRSMLCDTVYRFRAVEDIVLPEYLEIALNAPSIVQEINARKSGISESGISLNHGKLRSLPVPVPGDLTTQARIVEGVRERLSVVEHVGALVEAQAQRVEGLRQSILRRAFSGQLVAQDTRDEPASALLERIAAGQESAKKRRSSKNGEMGAA